MLEDAMQAWEALPQETKDKLCAWAEHMMKVIIEAAKAIVKAITDAFKHFVDTFVSTLPYRYTAQIEAAKVEWHARGPRRNRALVHAILARRRGNT